MKNTSGKRTRTKPPERRTLTREVIGEVVA
jgi:hypothetical protein